MSEQSSQAADNIKQILNGLANTTHDVSSKINEGANAAVGGVEKMVELLKVFETILSTTHEAHDVVREEYQVIENVKNQKSEVGILYLNDFNRKVMEKIFHENSVEFIELFPCSIYVFLWKGSPLAQKKLIEFEDLKDYPCLSFEQGEENSFYFAEEVFSTYEYKQIIKVNDRATMLNLMIGLHGYTLCSGIICNNLNGNEYVAIPLHTDEKMYIGYLKKKGMPLSRLGEKYILELKKFEKNVL